MSEELSKKKTTYPILTVFRYYWQSMKPYKWMVVLTFVAYGLATFVANVFQPLIFRRIVDLVSTVISDRTDASNELWKWFGYYVIITFFVQIVLYRIGEFSLTRVESRTMKRLSDAAFTDLHRHGYRFFSDSFSGSLVARAKRYISSFETLFDTMVFSFWMTSVQVVGMFVTLLFFTPVIAVVFLIFTILYVVFSWWIMKKKMIYDELSAKQDSKITAELSDALSNVLTIKIFSAEKQEIDSFAETSSQWESAKQKSWSFQNIVFAWQTVFLGTLEVVSVGLSLELWIRGVITPGTVVLVQWYMASIFMSMFQLNRSFGRVVRSLSEASEMVEIFETPAEVIDLPTPKKLENVRGELALNHLTFQYSDGAKVFEDLNIVFRAGEKVGIVGSSGAGKSTLTKLLLRFLDPQSGSVTIDGVDIRELAQADARQTIAYVPQEPALFHRSLRENIAYGKPGATLDEVIAAAKLAHAHEFISKLSKGYETLVGERGVKLSGGERQRVAIARAILKNAPILVLDEATSALDTVSEQYIQEALDSLMHGKTTLVIAHRLSTIRKMDKILVFAEGKIIEEGTHDELVNREGVYAGFWTRQTSGFIDESDEEDEDIDEVEFFGDEE